MPEQPAPPGWQWRRLTDIAHLESGHTPSRKHLEYWNGDIPWVGIRDAKLHHGQAITDTEQHVSQLGIDNSSARVLPSGTVCLSRTASVGYVLTMARPMATSQDFANWVCSDELEPRFLVHLFLAEKRSFSRFSSGAVHQTIYYPELKGFHVCIPEIEEQRRIVTLLDTAFAGLAQAISNTEKNLTSVSRLIESHCDAIISADQHGRIATSLGDEIDLLTGFAFKSKEYMDSPDSIRLLRGDNILQGYFRWENVKKWPAHKAPQFVKYQLAEDDVVLAMDRTWVKAGIKFARVSKDDLPCLLVQRVARLRCNEGLHPDYLFFVVGSKFFRDYVLSIQTGLGVPHISGKQIQDFRFYKPGVEDQIVIASKLRAVTNFGKLLKSVHERKLAAITELGQSLLQNAFSGELTAADANSIKKEVVA